MKKYLLIIFIFVLVCFSGCEFGGKTDRASSSYTKNVVEAAKKEAASVFEGTVETLINPALDRDSLHNALMQYTELQKEYSKNPKAWSAVRAYMRYTSLDYFAGIDGKGNDAAANLKTSTENADLYTKYLDISGNFSAALANILDLYGKINSVIDEAYCGTDEEKFTDFFEILEDSKVKIKKSEAKLFPNLVEVNGNVASLKYPAFYTWDDNTTADYTIPEGSGPADSRTPVGFSVSITDASGNEVSFSNGRVVLDYNTRRQRFSVKISDLIPADLSVNRTVTVGSERALRNPITGNYDFYIHDPGSYVLTVAVEPSTNSVDYRINQKNYVFKIEDPVDVYTDELLEELPDILISSLGSMLAESGVKTASYYKDLDPAYFELLKNNFSAKNDDPVYNLNELIESLFIQEILNTIEKYAGELSLKNASVSTSSLFYKLVGNVSVPEDQPLTLDEFFAALGTDGAVKKLNDLIYI